MKSRSSKLIHSYSCTSVCYFLVQPWTTSLFLNVSTFYIYIKYPIQISWMSVLQSVPDTAPISPFTLRGKCKSQDWHKLEKERGCTFNFSQRDVWNGKLELDGLVRGTTKQLNFLAIQSSNAMPLITQPRPNDNTNKIICHEKLHNLLVEKWS